MRFLVLPILLIVSLLCSCALFEGKPKPLDADELQELEAGLGSIQRDYQLTSLAVGAVTPNKVLFQLELGPPQDTYHLASVTKVLTAVAAIKLISVDRLSLESPISFYLGDAEADGLENVTVANLLSHTSGIRGCGLDEKQVCPVIPSGISYHYENKNYEYLALIIEQITGVAFHEYLAAEVFEPLGIQKASVCETDLPKGSGEVCLGPIEMGFFLQAILAWEPRVMSWEGYDLLFSHTVAGFFPNRHLLWNSCYDHEDLITLSHAGVDQASGAEVMLYLDEGVAYYILTSNRYSAQFFAEIHELIRKKLYLRQCTGDTASSPTIQQMAGIYGAENEIEFQEHSLILNGKKKLYHAINGTRFAVYDEGLDEELAVPLANAAGDVIEMIVFDGEVKGAVWRNVYLPKMH